MDGHRQIEIGRSKARSSETLDLVLKVLSIVVDTRLLCQYIIVIVAFDSCHFTFVPKHETQSKEENKIIFLLEHYISDTIFHSFDFYFHLNIFECSSMRMVFQTSLLDGEKGNQIT